ncbi:MAG: hypothetical protein DRG37_01905 [Deltaproteobacteria bacterium]|nr:MAG: hypothetical protein DRG37_01905 [Deltaproteobacteria bacterium]
MAEPNQSLYLYKVPRVQITHARMDFVLERCRDKTVLHLGCADEGLTKERINSGTLLHTRLMDIAKDVYGIDRSESALDILRSSGIGNLFKGDVEEIETIPLPKTKFDVIVAAELLEHLDNPGKFLDSVKLLFTKDTIMIISTPSPFRLSGLWQALRGYEYVHPDHNFWFSWKTLSSLLKKHGYSIEETAAYSFVDKDLPIIRRLITKALGKSSHMHSSYSTKINRFNKNKTENIITDRLKTVSKVLSRRLLYTLNPFFSDGLIFVVKPEQ